MAITYFSYLELCINIPLKNLDVYHIYIMDKYIWYISHTFICQFVSCYPYLSIYLSINLCLNVYRSCNLSVYRADTHIILFLSNYLSIFIFIYLSIYISIYLSIQFLWLPRYIYSIYY